MFWSPTLKSLICDFLPENVGLDDAVIKITKIQMVSVDYQSHQHHRKKMLILVFSEGSSLKI